jgi:ElaB/YqjD/DUF883 family membrane-anchored ribosome-binding protein
LKKLSANKRINIELGEERGQDTMAQSVLERTGEQIAESARKASRATSAVADAIEDGMGAARRVAKQGGDAAEELLDDTTKRLQRHPIETVVVTFAIGVSAGIAIGWMMKRR